ncbi:hypothetical protein H4S02_005440, partial [Coemansia sp. RSA 2611]
PHVLRPPQLQQHPRGHWPAHARRRHRRVLLRAQAHGPQPAQDHAQVVEPVPLHQHKVCLPQGEFL